MANNKKAAAVKVSAAAETTPVTVPAAPELSKRATEQILKLQGGAVKITDRNQESCANVLLSDSGDASWGTIVTRSGRHLMTRLGAPGSEWALFRITVRDGQVRLDFVSTAKSQGVHLDALRKADLSA